MLNKIKKSNQGFTIIEVLIVLAIAGLIMIIVFLAVPALRRNSANTAIRNDASKILSATGESVANNNGTLPADTTTGDTSIKASANTGQTVLVGTKSAGVVSSKVDTVQIIKGAKCKDGATLTTGALSALDADKNNDLVEDSTARSYVILFQVESPGGNYTNQCLGS